MTEQELWWLNVLMEEIDGDKYTEWEQKFVQDLVGRVEKNPDYTLSEKQFDCLERIYNK